MSAEAISEENLEKTELLSSEEKPVVAPETSLVVAPALPEAEFVEETKAETAAVAAEETVWQIIPCLPRHDSFNHSDLMQEIHSVLAEGARFVALDLTQNRFFSLNAIQLCVSLARDLAADDGCLALVGCPEKTKRHFDIYGSLSQILVVRTKTDLAKSRKLSTIVVRSRTKLAAPES